jgi:hypothetical protein
MRRADGAQHLVRSTARFVILAFLFQFTVTAGIAAVRPAAEREPRWPPSRSAGSSSCATICSMPRPRAADAALTAGSSTFGCGSAHGELAVILLTTAADKVIRRQSRRLADGRARSRRRGGRSSSTAPAATGRAYGRRLHLLPERIELLAGHVIMPACGSQQVDAEAITAAFLIGVVFALLSAVLLARALQPDRSYRGHHRARSQRRCAGRRVATDRQRRRVRCAGPVDQHDARSDRVAGLATAADYRRAGA